MWFHIVLLSNIHTLQNMHMKLCNQVDTQSQILVQQVEKIRAGVGSGMEFENQQMQELKELMIQYAHENKLLC